MPSQLAHLFFAADALGSALPRGAFHTVTAYKGALGLGAQGPDIFLHNRRSKPSGLRYGARLHRAGYGTVLAEAAAAAAAAGADPLGETAAYLYAFATHAALDRYLHPYINYRAGRRERGRPETALLGPMHAYLERLIDTALLSARLGVAPCDARFHAYFDIGSQLPQPIASALAVAFEAEIPSARRDGLLYERIANGYRDARSYYAWAHRDLPAARRAAALSAGTLADRMRRLAILHPEAVPLGLDVLNLRRRVWRDPCPSGRKRRTESVPQLYAEALDHAVPVVRALFSLLNRGSEAYAKTAAEPNHPTHTPLRPGSTAPSALRVRTLVGDSDLSDHYNRPSRCSKHYSNPLPLYRILERQLLEILETAELTQRGQPSERSGGRATTPHERS